MKKNHLILTLLIMLSTVVFAQNDTVKVKKLMPRPPIYGIPTKTLPKGKIIYRSYFTFTDFSSMYSTQKSDMISLPNDMSFQSYSYTPKLRYGITNKLTFIANFPVFYKDLNHAGNVKTGIGLGDIVASTLYNFYHNKKKKFFLSGLLYTKLPTGKSSNLNTNELPLGTGSFDAGIALLSEKEIKKFDMRLNAFYIYRGQNKAGINLGDAQMFAFSTAYNFSKKFIVEGSILYKQSLNNFKDKQELPDTYIHLSQFIIGAQYRLAPRFLIQAAVPVTLFAKTPFSSNYDAWLGFFILY